MTTRAKLEITLNYIYSLTTGPNSKELNRNVPDYAPYQNCTNGIALLEKGTVETQDKKCLKTTSPEPHVQFQNDFTEMFLIMPWTKNCTNVSATDFTEAFIIMSSTKVAQTVPLH